MSFAKEIRDNALVKAARHCCVCRRYTGLKIEVHHIVPISEGGSNDESNAIALCFDCHADAGHYNQAHPRGTKFSREELIKARDSWYEQVERGGIVIGTQTGKLHCRYYVCKEIQLISRISQHMTDELPFGNPLVHSNEVLAFHKWLSLKYMKRRYRREVFPGKQHKDENSYFKAHPNAVFFLGEHNGRENAHARHAVNYDEARRIMKVMDPLTMQLINEGVPIENLVCGMCDWEMCGSCMFDEIYKLRPLWAIYLAITNISSSPIKFPFLIASTQLCNALHYRSLGEQQVDRSDVLEIPLPSSPILPNECIVIPLATVLAPFHTSGCEQSFEEYEVSGDHADFQRVVSHYVEIVPEDSDYHLIGPAIFPKAIEISCAGQQIQEPIHELNLSNLYIVDKYYMCGSCPHLFFHMKDGSLKHAGTILDGKPMLTHTTRLQIPKDVKALVIAEIEAETTVLREVSVDDEIVESNVVLSQGDSISLHVKHGQIVDISGCYIPRFSPKDSFNKRKYSEKQVNEFLAFQRKP